jgi:hypothetical protein
MDESLVFAKTAEGTSEVTLRVGGLSLQARRVLIMIDGERSIADLAPLVRAGEIEAVITLLQSCGFIRDTSFDDPGSGGASPPGDPAAGPRTTDGATGGGAVPEERFYLTLEEGKRRAVRELTERLGPGAESIAMRIERSNNADELGERLREAERLVARTVGEASAQDFVRAMRRR